MHFGCAFPTVLCECERVRHSWGFLRAQGQQHKDNSNLSHHIWLGDGQSFPTACEEDVENRIFMICMWAKTVCCPCVGQTLNASTAPPAVHASLQINKYKFECTCTYLMLLFMMAIVDDITAQFSFQYTEHNSSAVHAACVCVCVVVVA